MIKFFLSEVDVTVWLDVAQPNDFAEIQYEGDRDLVEEVREDLESSYGAFGHLIGSSTSAIDLHAAMVGPVMQEYQPELIEGAELVKRYDPGIPDGAVT